MKMKIHNEMDIGEKSHQRIVDKSLIPTCDIMGVKIAAINKEWLLDFTEKHIKELSGDYMCVANVHTTVTASENPEYCQIQNSGIMAIPDGGPLSTIGRKRGYTQMARVTGPEYMEAVLNLSEQKGYRHYFYGSTNETLERLKKKLSERQKNIQVVGMYSPPFRELSEEEDTKIVKNINDTHADFVWIGLGAPKQEQWMAKHQGKVNGFMVGVGAAFDYYAGNIKRAPMWMQKANLEWLYRLIQEPRRLLKRYLVTNTKFIWKVIIRGE